MAVLISSISPTTAAGGNAVADEPGRRQRHETFHRLYGQRRGPAREGRVDERPAQSRGCRHGSRDRHPPRQPRGSKVRGEPDHEAEHQWDVAPGHDQPGPSGRHRQHRQRPAPQQDNRAAPEERDDEVQPRLRVRPDRQSERDQLGAGDEHDNADPPPLTECTEKRFPRGSPGRLIPSHTPTVTSPSAECISLGNDERAAAPAGTGALVQPGRMRRGIPGLRCVKASCP